MSRLEFGIQVVAMRGFSVLLMVNTYPQKNQVLPDTGAIW
jgi:hypothetical protein